MINEANSGRHKATKAQQAGHYRSISKYVQVYANTSSAIHENTVYNVFLSNEITTEHISSSDIQPNAVIISQHL